MLLMNLDGSLKHKHRRQVLLHTMVLRKEPQLQIPLGIGKEPQLQIPDAQGIREDHRVLVARLNEVEECASVHTLREFMSKILRLESMLSGEHGGVIGEAIRACNRIDSHQLEGPTLCGARLAVPSMLSSSQNTLKAASNSKSGNSVCTTLWTRSAQARNFRRAFVVAFAISLWA